MNSMLESSGPTSSKASIGFRQKIGESVYAEVFRVYGNTPHPLIVKQLKASELLPDWLSSLRQQYLQWREIQLVQILIPSSIDESAATVVTWDWRRPTLEEWLVENESCPLDVFFKVARGLAAILVLLEQHKLFHGSIKPSNILIDPLTLEVRLTDVLRVVDYRSHSVFIADPYFLQHTLPYLAPEQSGKLNQPLGPATDLYGLGCVFYRILVGQPVFTGHDPAKIMHAIMATQPAPPHKLNALLPEPLSLCISRMLTKDPAKRYSSAASLLHDLLNMETEYKRTGAIRAFAPDVDGLKQSAQITLSRYVTPIRGRDQERDALLRRFEATAQGRFTVVLISGPSGIGKSRLMEVLQEPCVQAGGYFITMQASPEQRQVPYALWSQILRMLVRNLLSEDVNRVAHWQQILKKKLAGCPPAIVEIVPEIEPYLSNLNDYFYDTSKEVKQSLFYGLKSLLEVVLERRLPLVVGLDNLQWVDQESLEFFAYLHHRGGDLSRLMLVAAFREESLLPSMRKLLDTLHFAETSPLELQLSPLKFMAIQELGLDILGAVRGDVQALGKLWWMHSQGNPAALIEFNRWMQQQGYLQSNEQAWFFFDEAAVAKAFTAEPKELLEQFGDLDQELYLLLSKVACLGNHFTLSDLSLLFDIPLQKLYRQLALVVQAGWLYQIGDYYYFSHERLRESLQNIRSEDDKRQINYHFGVMLAQNIPLDSNALIAPRLYEAATHLNYGRHDDISLNERLRDLLINYWAGSKALRQRSIDTAINYFYQAEQLLIDELYPLLRKDRLDQLLVKSGMAEALRGDLDTAQVRFECLLRTETNPALRAAILCHLGEVLVAQNKFEQAMPVYLEALTLMGHTTVVDASSVHRELPNLLHQLSDQLAWQANQPAESIAVPVIFEIMLECCAGLSAAYSLSGHTDLYFYYGALAAITQIKYVPDSNKWNHIYPVAICSAAARVYGHHELADILEAKALTHSRRTLYTLDTAYSYAVQVGRMMHWRNTLERLRESAREGAGVAAECNNYLVAGSCQSLGLLAEVVGVSDLKALAHNVSTALEFTRQYAVSWPHGVLQAISVGLLQPMLGKDVNPLVHSHPMISTTYHICRALGLYWLKDLEQMGIHLDAAQPLLPTVKGAVVEHFWQILKVLHALEVDIASSDKRETQNLSSVPAVQESLRRVQELSSLGPFWVPWQALIIAKISHLAGATAKARNLYLEAAQIAAQAHYDLLSGYLYECVGELYRTRQWQGADMYFRQAAEVYGQCHADAMLEHLQHNQPVIYAGYVAQAAGVQPESKVLLQFTRRFSGGLSGGFDASNLFEPVVETILEHLDANECFIISSREGALYLRVEGRKGQPSTIKLIDQPLIEVEGLIAREVVRHVQRTRNPLILNDASHVGLFVNDPEVAMLQERSLICYPVINRNKVLGIVYVRNNMLANALTEQDAEFIEIIAAQVANLFEMARLYRAQQETLEALYKEMERAHITLASIGDAVLTVDHKGFIEFMNPVAERLTGWRQEEAKGHALTEVFHLIDEVTRQPLPDPFDLCQAQQDRAAILSSGILLRRDNQELIVESSISSLKSARDQMLGAVIVFHDETEARKLAQEITYQASHDALTGLVNRREFEQRLERLLSTAQENRISHCLLYLDLDQFKIVNDTCGHGAGDQLLKQLSNLLRQHVRKSDTLARLGGDEFGVLLESCDEPRGLEIAEAMRAAIQEMRFLWEGKTFGVGVSIGLVPIEGHVSSKAEVLSNADSACYTAKEMGRNRIHVYHHNDQQLERRRGEMSWISRLNQALVDNSFVLYGQQIMPIHNASGLHPRVEVLLRLKGEGDEIFPPGAFLPAAERYGLSSTLDRWVVKESLQWLRERKTAGLALHRLNINLSGAAYGDLHFMDFLIEHLQALQDIDLSGVCFEVTETDAISNLQTATDFMMEIRKLGCQFALDDFGSGMSSFGYLRSLPIDFIKIDGVFVRDIAQDAVHRAMVKSIRDVGAVMGKQIIAEFVEDEATLEILRSMQIDYAQGYGIGRPKALSLF